MNSDLEGVAVAPPHGLLPGLGNLEVDALGGFLLVVADRFEGERGPSGKGEREENGEGLEHGYNGISDDNDNDDDGDLLYDDKYNSYQGRNVTLTGGKRERVTSGEIIDTGSDRKTKHGENSELDEASVIS